MNNSFRSMLSAASSALSLALSMPEAKLPVAASAAPGKKPGAIGRHLIRREVTGPFFRQVGTRNMRDADGKLLRTAIVTERYVVERVLHATKGWRTRNRPLDRRLHPV